VSTPVIEVRDLRKVFKSTMKRPITALDGIDFTVRPGELFGLLGPNGAGKTTTVKILLGLTHATSGDARLLGITASNPESRRRVGYLPEGHRFPGYLTARETLSIFGRMSGVSAKEIEARMGPLLERLRIGQWRDVRVKKFSKGMVQRLGLAAALIHEPEVVLLDEPTDGVDPVGRREIRDLLQEEARKGRAILLNSHLLSEIELTCDRVAVLRRGKVAVEGSIAELTRTDWRYRFSVSAGAENLAERFVAAGATVAAVNGSIEVVVRDHQHLNQLIDEARSSGQLITEITPLRSSLEDIFVDLVRTTSGEVGAEVSK
jgi:ABC-2 type transport system ATP-binding protein